MPMMTCPASSNLSAHAIISAIIVITILAIPIFFEFLFLAKVTFQLAFNFSLLFLMFFNNCSDNPKSLNNGFLILVSLPILKSIFYYTRIVNFLQSVLSSTG